MANSIDLAKFGANDIIACNNANYAGAIKIVAGKIAAGNVTFIIDGKTINLSDAGCSYLSTSLEAINKAKPAAAKGQYIRSCVIASTMGPGVKVNTTRLMELGAASAEKA